MRGRKRTITVRRQVLLQKRKVFHFQKKREGEGEGKQSTTGRKKQRLKSEGRGGIANYRSQKQMEEGYVSPRKVGLGGRNHCVKNPKKKGVVPMIEGKSS